MSRPLAEAMKDLADALAEAGRTIADTFEPFARRRIEREEAEATRALGFRPCPDNLPHGHGREGEYAFTEPCPSCGAVL